MFFYSTNKQSKNFRFPEVLRLGLAPDKGLFMPKSWPVLPKQFFQKLANLSFNEIAFQASRVFVSGMPVADLKKNIHASFNFRAPLVPLKKNIFVLELFHGPTMAFKDFGVRFLSRILSHYLKSSKEIWNIIVATSGDTGSAVASGFYKVPGIRIFILYPSGKVSPLQKKQLTTYGQNIIALEVKGSFDDCQRLAKLVLVDEELNRQMRFSSANSINFGRLLPQSFYYFWAISLLKKMGIDKPPVFVVPSGNFGNILAGLMAKKMGLSVYQFIAATNSNDIVPKFLQTGRFFPKQSKHTISNAMDVGNPSNFARMLEMYGGSYRRMGKDITAFSVSDTETKNTIKNTYSETGYICDPHTAVGIAAALKHQKQDDNHPIVVLSTAHPAKFKEIIEPVIHHKIILPEQLRKVLNKKEKTRVINNNYEELRRFLLSINIP
jgi:threonine synthase